MDYKKLEQKIIEAYTTGITLQEAENLAGEFLTAQIQISEELKKQSLEAKVLKASSKKVRAEVFYAEATKTDKKPSDSMLQAVVDKDAQVLGAQQDFDEAEEAANELERLFNIFKDAHIYYRGIGRGKFE